MDTKLHQAVQAGNLTQVKKLLADGANVNAKDKYGNTSLHLAIIRIASSYSSEDVMKLIRLLIGRGADVNAANQNRQTPLHWSVMYGHKEILELLIENKANVNAKDKNGATPLQWAQRNEYQKIVDLLATYGAE